MVLPSNRVAFPLTVEPSTWKSPGDWIAPMDGGDAIKKSKQPLVKRERNDHSVEFIRWWPPEKFVSAVLHQRCC